MLQNILDAIDHELHFIDDEKENSFEILPYSETKGAVGAAALAIKDIFSYNNTNQ